jgi:hypothetical protein
MNFLMYDPDSDVLDFAIIHLKDCGLAITGTTKIERFEEMAASGLYDHYVIEPYNYAGDVSKLSGHIRKSQVTYFTCSDTLDLGDVVYKLDWEELESRLFKAVKRYAGKRRQPQNNDA